MVGLPDWDNKHEVLVQDSASQQLRIYKAGDALGGGTVQMIDYRFLPSPANPQILSPSRVILKVGPDFWAIELGQAVTEKRRLKRDQLPPQLQSAPTTAPAENVERKPLAAR